MLIYAGLYIDKNKQAIVRSDIIKNKRLNNIEIHHNEKEIVKKIIIENNENSAEVPIMNREQLSAPATGNKVRQTFETKGTTKEETNEVENEQTKIIEMSQEMIENPYKITPEL